MPTPFPTVRLLCLLLLLHAAPRAGAAPLAAQIPDTFVNLQVLPEDIGRDSLLAVMRSFSFATGLRCEGCHVLGPEGAFQGARFDLDEKREKEIARHMLRMVDRINGEMLAALPGRAAPPLQVECKTCHRGLPRPHLLRTELRALIEAEGAGAAEARYRELREGALTKGAYDFREWEMNELARQLAADGRLEDALVMLALNEEFHPASAAIPLEAGRLHERLGQREQALAAYRRVLERAPQHPAARARIQALDPPPG